MKPNSWVCYDISFFNKMETKFKPTLAILIFLPMMTLKKYFIYLFLERGGEGEKERERPISVWLPLSCPPHQGDLAGNPGTHPDWESNQRPFGLQAGIQSTEPH